VERGLVKKSKLQQSGKERGQKVWLDCAKKKKKVFKKLSKSDQKVVKSCQKVVKNFVKPGNKRF
jgi:hypothetical protein